MSISKKQMEKIINNAPSWAVAWSNAGGGIYMSQEGFCFGSDLKYSHTSPANSWSDKSKRDWVEFYCGEGYEFIIFQPPVLENE